MSGEGWGAVFLEHSSFFRLCMTSVSCWPKHVCSPAPLPCSFNVANWKWYHDISLAIFTESSVYSNGRAFDMNIDSHRGGGWVGGGGAPAMSQFTALQLSCPTLWPPLALLIAA